MELRIAKPPGPGTHTSDNSKSLHEHKKTWHEWFLWTKCLESAPRLKCARVLFVCRESHFAWWGSCCLSLEFTRPRAPFSIPEGTVIIRSKTRVCLFTVLFLFPGLFWEYKRFLRARSLHAIEDQVSLRKSLKVFESKTRTCLRFLRQWARVPWQPDWNEVWRVI